MSGVVRSVGKMFGFGRPKVDKGMLALENRRKLREQERGLDLEQREEASRLRSARGGRRAALASQFNLGETLG